MTEEFITVGKLGRARGVQGEMYITPMTDFPDRFLGMREIYLRQKDRWEMVRVDSTRLVSGRPVIKLEGVNTPEQAARFSNREMAVPRSQTVKLPDGYHYIFDLIGCKVFDEDTKSELGEIVGVETYPANDVYTIRMADGKTVLLPAVKSFVKAIDTIGKKVIINKTGILEQ